MSEEEIQKKREQLKEDMGETNNDVFECKGCGTIIKAETKPLKCSACGSKKVLGVNEEAARVALTTTKEMIRLPGEGRLISEFAKELADCLKTKKTLFFRESSSDVLEIGDVKDEEDGEEYIGFREVKPERFITLIEKYITPFIRKKGDFGWEEKEKSLNSSTSKTVLMSEILHSSLPPVKRIFTIPIPVIHDGEITFPKKGYDKRFCSWMPLNAPTIKTDMSLEEAKELIKGIFKEFCFQDHQAYINAIAGLLTPFLKGLYPSFSTRTPVFMYIANRERAGKDYCADITGLVMEGYAIQEPPISTGEKSSNNNEELRKKVLSALIAGRKRIHFANNKGYINNAVFEGIITSPKYSDRALGRNEILTLDNEIDFSLSGNVGIGFTPDLANRSRMITLFLDIEDANERKFERPNLHAWVLDNRNKVLSALYALVKNWHDNECPEGSVPFSSFPDWAKICGGIMEAAGYDSPCRSDKKLRVAGDSETTDMKTLFEIGFERYANEWITKKDIRNIIINEDEPLFGYLEFNNKSDQTKFGMMINKFAGRMLSGISLVLQDENVRSSRQKFMFTETKREVDKNKIFSESEKDGNLGNPW